MKKDKIKILKRLTGAFYLSHATASISVCALLYSSSLLAREVRRCMIAGSSFRSEASCFPYKNNTLNAFSYHTIGFSPISGTPNSILSYI